MKLEKLTSDQEKLMIQVRDEWINLALKNNVNGINKPMFEEGVKWLYNDLLKKPEPKIIYCDSWLSCLITISILKRTSASVWASVWASVGASVGASFSEYSSYVGYNNYGWVSFYDFFDRINVLENFNFKQYKKLMLSNAFNAYEYENYIFAIQPPIRIVKNSNNVLHSTSESAIKFKDGSEYFFINGRSMPAWIFEKHFNNSLAKEDFINEGNEDIKAGIYEIIESQGEGSMLSFLNAEEVDKQTIIHRNGDMEDLILYKTKEVFNEEVDLNGKSGVPLAWLKMTCPSTGTNYLIPSDSSFDNCIDAAKYHRPTEVPITVDYIWDQRN